MILKNKKLLKRLRRPGKCEYCQRMCKKREPAHVVSVGSGGSDLVINLVSLGQTVSHQCHCHTNSHAGKRPTQQDLLEILAKREGCSVEDLLAVIWFIQRLDKNASKYRIEEELLKLPEAVRKIARRELAEAGKLEVIDRT